VNPQTMTLDEVRDALAVMDGYNKWNVATTVDGVTNIGRETWHAPNQEGKTTINFGPHPYPATLDGAASALPKGWTWSKYVDDRENEDGWYAWRKTYRGVGHYPITGNEILDRYRLALACRIAEMGDAK